MAAVRVVPRCVCDPLPVRRPLRVELADVGAGQASGLAVGQVLRPQAVEGGEGDALAARGRHRRADLAGDDHGGGIDLIGELHLGADPQLHLGLEGNLDGVTAVHRDAPDLAAVRDDDRRPVGDEGVAGQEVQRRPRLLLVALHGVGQPLLVARLQVALAQSRVGVVAGGVDEPAAVGRDRRAHRRPVSGGHEVVDAGLAVVPVELVARQGGVVLPVAGAAGVPDVTAVGADRRAHHLAGAGSLPQREGRASFDVVEAQLGGAAQRGCSAGDDVVAVGRPLGGQHEAPATHAGGVGLVQAHRPYRVVPAPVGDERDGFAVGAEAGLDLVGHPREEGRSLPAGRGHGVQVAQQVEDDRLPVGAHVQGYPGAFGGGELGGARAGQGQGILPTPTARRPLGLRRRRDEDQGRQQPQQECGAGAACHADAAADLDPASVVQQASGPRAPCPGSHRPSPGLPASCAPGLASPASASAWRIPARTFGAVLRHGSGGAARCLGHSSSSVSPS